MIKHFTLKFTYDMTFIEYATKQVIYSATWKVEQAISDAYSAYESLLPEFKLPHLRSADWVQPIQTTIPFIRDVRCEVSEKVSTEGYYPKGSRVRIAFWHQNHDALANMTAHYSEDFTFISLQRHNGVNAWSPEQMAELEAYFSTWNKDTELELEPSKRHASI